ncbi:MAG: YbaN family protein [Culicoidibacterales bacterium]
MKKIRQALYVSCGFIALGLAFVGMILPVIPTTPFLLLASVCFVKGSKRFDTWFKQTKIYQLYLADYVAERAMTSKQKWTILSFASVMLLFPLFFIDSLVMKGVIIALYIGKYYYFLVRIPTINKKLEVNS